MENKTMNEDSMGNEIYEALLELYQKRGYNDFLEMYNDVHHLMSNPQKDTLMSEIDARRRSLTKEGAGMGTVATTDSGGLGFTPTFGGDGTKRKKRSSDAAVELETWLDNQLSKSEEHEYPVRDGDDKDVPQAVEFPSEMDTTAVETQQDVMTQIEEINDHDKDRRSRESDLSSMVNPSDDLQKILDKIEKEEYDRQNPVLTKSIASPILQKADDLAKAGTPNAFFVALNNTIEEHRANLKVEKNLEQQEVHDDDTT